MVGSLILQAIVIMCIVKRIDWSLEVQKVGCGSPAYNWTYINWTKLTPLAIITVEIINTI